MTSIPKGSSSQGRSLSTSGLRQPTRVASKRSSYRTSAGSSGLLATPGRLSLKIIGTCLRMSRGLTLKEPCRSRSSLAHRDRSSMIRLRMIITTRWRCWRTSAEQGRDQAARSRLPTLHRGTSRPSLTRRGTTCLSTRQGYSRKSWHR